MPLIEQNPPHAVVSMIKPDFSPIIVAACIVVSRPRLAMAKLTGLFAVAGFRPHRHSPNRCDRAGAKIGENVAIGAYGYIGANAVIGANSVLHPQVYIGPELLLVVMR